MEEGGQGRIRRASTGRLRWGSSPLGPSRGRAPTGTDILGEEKLEESETRNSQQLEQGRVTYCF